MMNKSIGLMSTTALSDGEIGELVIIQNGRHTKNIYFPFRISKDQVYIDIGTSPEDLESIIRGLDDPLDPDGERDSSKFCSMLGGQPRTLVIIEIGRAEGSEALAYDFVLRFGERWPVVVLDNVGDLVSLEDMRHRRDAGTEL